MATKKWAKARWYIGTKTTPLENEAAWILITDGRAAGGSIGKEWRTTDATTFDDEDVRNAKTIFESGQIDLTYLPKLADPGQVALKAACDDSSDDPYNFKLELNDAPVSGTPTTFLFHAQVTARTIRGGNPTNILEAMARLDLQGEVIEQEAV